MSSWQASGAGMGRAAKSAALALVMLAVLLALASCAPHPEAPSGAEVPPGQQSPAEFVIQTINYLLIAIFVLWFFIWRPQQARDEQRRRFKAQLKKGDEVVTSGGILGRVSSIKEDTVTVEIAPNTRVRVQVEHLAAAPSAAPKKGAAEERAGGKKS